MDPRNEDPKSQVMVRFSIRMLIPFEKHREVFDMLMSVCDQSQSEPHCISSHLYMCMDEMRAILFEEFWINCEQLLRNLQSDIYRRVLIAVELAEKPPDIHFDEIIRTSGIEIIKNAITK